MPGFECESPVPSVGSPHSDPAAPGPLFRWLRAGGEEREGGRGRGSGGSPRWLRRKLPHPGHCPTFPVRLGGVDQQDVARPSTDVWPVVTLRNHTEKGVRQRQPKKVGIGSHRQGGDDRDTRGQRPLRPALPQCGGIWPGCRGQEDLPTLPTWQTGTMRAHRGATVGTRARGSGHNWVWVGACGFSQALPVHQSVGQRGEEGTRSL